LPIRAGVAIESVDRSIRRAALLLLQEHGSAIMSLAPSLQLRQSQSLVMTPQLQQAIRLLACSNLEIEGFIAEEVEKNPLLESGPTEVSDTPEPVDNGRDGAPEAADHMIGGEGGAGESLDVDWGEAEFHHDSASDMAGSGFDGALGQVGGGSGAGGDAEAIDFDGFACAEPTLHDHLQQQAGEMLDGPQLLIAVALIDRIDAAGYLDGRLIDIANEIGAPLAACEDALAVIHGFDPCGVGARNLAECLAIQAKDADRYDPAMACMIAHLDLLAKGALPQLKRICGVDDEDIADMVREIRTYDPKPGLRYQSDDTRSVVPDIFIERRKTGWSVELNAATLPRVLINRRYYAELARGAAAKSKAWLSECLASANWLVKALDQRQRTIVKVAAEIVKQQEGFFLHGVAQMKPLTLKAVADAIGMHESTVSRVTSNKYLSCARGVFELKYFFSSGIQSSDGGEAASAEAVKAAIKALIDAEEPKKILSDDTLVDRLKDKGFDIARRTVAKYRESLGIGSSVQRRRQKKMLAG